MLNNENERIYLDQIDKLTKPFRDFIIQNFFVIIGSSLYISFLFMSLYTYSPNYFACLSYLPMFYILFLILLHSILFLILFLYFLNKVNPTYIIVDQYLINNLFMLISLVFILNYVYLFVKCRDRSYCNKNEKCTIDELTEYNTRVNNQVSNLHVMGIISNFYIKINEEQERINISLCSNYYNNSYNNDLDNSTKTNCTGPKQCIIGKEVETSAPIISEFYIMSSSKTCRISDFYVSEKMIEIALNAGFRCLDFDLFSFNCSLDAFPIVANENFHNLFNTSRSSFNYITWKDVCKTIIHSYFKNFNTTYEPLFLHLNIHEQCTEKTQDQIALLIRYYFTEYNSFNLLFENSINLNFGELNICQLFNKVIIIVKMINNRKISTSLKEVTNILSGNNIKDKTYTELKSMINKKSLRSFSKRHLIYSNSITDQNYYNFDPILPFNLGCQFVAVNMSNIDDNLMKYLTFFKNASYILKPKNYRRSNTLYTNNIKSKYDGTIPGIPCSDDQSDLKSDSVNITKCKTTEANQSLNQRNLDLEKSHELNKERTKAINNKTVFF